MEPIGTIVAGKTAKILIREKSGAKLEIGDLLVVEEDAGYLILQVNDLLYASQLPDSARELIAGINLEGKGAGNLEFLEPELRNYILAQAKAVLQVHEGNPRIPKVLPSFFKSIRPLTEKDIAFLSKPKNPVFLGNVRSGSKVLKVPVYLDATDVFTHHVLVPATTGRGKSNLIKVMLWSLLELGGVGALVLDPHDEYFGKDGKGLKDHPKAKERLLYYSPDAPPGQKTLLVNLRSIRPDHLAGIVPFSEAQQEALIAYHRTFRENWITEIARGTAVPNVSDRTVGVLQRKFSNILGVEVDDQGNLLCRNRVFGDTAGETTSKDIVRALEAGKIVVLDTSRLGDDAELLVGSIIAGDILYKYQTYKSKGELKDKPPVTIVIEEAPRVLGADVAKERGENIYGTIAREGRKFKVGLVAITQLVSLIPKTVLANLNTKIILGNEMKPERDAIIGSASQDLSEDDRTIASLDKGEAIVSSIFAKFAVPIYVPLFEEWAKPSARKKEGDLAFVG